MQALSEISLYCKTYIVIKSFLLSETPYLEQWYLKYLHNLFWFKWKCTAQRWFTTEGLVFDTVNNSSGRQSQAVESRTPLQSSRINTICGVQSLGRDFILGHICIKWYITYCWMFSYDLLMWPRGETKHVIKSNSWGRLQNWLVILGPCLESLLSQTQRGTVSTVAWAVVFNYSQAVKIETVTIWFCGIFSLSVSGLVRERLLWTK